MPKLKRNIYPSRYTNFTEKYFKPLTQDETTAYAQYIKGAQEPIICHYSSFLTLIIAPLDRYTKLIAVDEVTNDAYYINFQTRFDVLPALQTLFTQIRSYNDLDKLGYYLFIKY